MRLTYVALLLLHAPLLVSAQFDFFEHMFEGATGGGRQQRRQQESAQGSPQWYEQNYETVECNGFVCEDTLSCVKRPVDCPCLFPDSQEKCILPDKKNYVCISTNGRGCEFVEKAWKGEV
ncbi:uncharacterized protein V2V93DRAFT_373129 [Kockiozyma suomiensis]|uniref:uncharacterized protein n=1 Tax=Kockiozyma suomiensis TaxID=1337062 RepID=UPI0033433E0D